VIEYNHKREQRVPNKGERKMNSIKITRESAESRTCGAHFKPVYETIEVKVGDGATMRFYSDRHACTIIEIADNGSYIKVQKDKATRTDNNGMSDCQDYEFERDPKGKVYTFKRTRKDKSVYTGNGKYDDWDVKLSFGSRVEYYDYSF
jgi:hypothetical protein